MSAISESGTYFKNIYTDLLNQAPKLPDSDPPPNLQQCIGAKPFGTSQQQASSAGVLSWNYVNFVRAEMLARQHNLSQEIVTHLREMAIFQYARDYTRDYNNVDVLIELAEEYGLTPSDRSRIVQLMEQEKEYPCYSFSKATELGDYIEHYAPIVREALLERFKRLFKRK